MTMPAIAVGTKSRKNRGSLGAAGHSLWRGPIPAAASAPREPAAVATAL
jgi:hypothetical protein